MEIQQAQTPITPTAKTSSSASNGVNGNAGSASLSSAQSKTGFSAALNGMLVGVSGGNQANTQYSLAGLNVLVQLMAGLKEDSTIPQEQSMEDSLKQLDALINLLDSNTEDASALLENPDVQAWLAQILNPLLFVPLETASDDGESLQTLPVVQMQPLSKEEAQERLESFKQLLQTNSEQAAAPQTGKVLQKIVADLQQILAPLISAQSQNDATTDSVSDSEIAVQLLPTQPSGRSVAITLQASPSGSSGTKNVKSDAIALVQVNVTTVNPKLEYLAAKSAAPKLTVEDTSYEAPLFEPLQEIMVDMNNDNPVMPMHEFLKQVQNGEQLVKTPVLMMQAPTFVEDMTEFVIKSFTLDARAEGITEAKLSLYPQHLGQVDVKITMHNGQLVAQFMAESAMGKEMLESQLTQLRTTLQSQGIQVEKLEVTQSQSFQSGLFQEQRQQQFQQSNKQEKGNGTGKVLSLDEELALEATKSAPDSTRLGQTSIDITA